MSRIYREENNVDSSNPTALKKARSRLRRKLNLEHHCSSFNRLVKRASDKISAVFNWGSLYTEFKRSQAQLVNVPGTIFIIHAK